MLIDPRTQETQDFADRLARLPPFIKSTAALYCAGFDLRLTERALDALEKLRAPFGRDILKVLVDHNEGE